MQDLCNIKCTTPLDSLHAHTQRYIYNTRELLWAQIESPSSGAPGWLQHVCVTFLLQSTCLQLSGWEKCHPNSLQSHSVYLTDYYPSTCRVKMYPALTGKCCQCFSPMGPNCYTLSHVIARIMFSPLNHSSTTNMAVSHHRLPTNHA